MSLLKRSSTGATVLKRPSLPFLDHPPLADAGGGTSAPIGKDGPSKVAALRPQQIRRQWLRWSALAMVGLPTLLVALYYVLLAANQYSVEVRFAVRGGTHVSAPTGGVEMLSSLAGLSVAGSTVSDTYIVMDFIKSREIIEKMRPLVDIRAVYSHPSADFAARLNPGSDIEDVVDYWRGMIEVSNDTISGIIAVRVRAFSREDAVRVAEGVLASSEELINGLSERARVDALKFAEHEVKRTEDRLRVNRALVRQFRDQQQEFDPVKKAETQLSLQGRIEADLAAARARMATARRYMQENAPSVAFLDTQIKSLERQLEQERAKLGKGAEAVPGGVTLSGQVAAYEELLVEREFAEKAYVSALATMEKARGDAAQQQRYLATFVRPSLPQEALYPRRLLNTLMVLVGAGMLWGITVLLVYAIRDHAG